MRVNQLLVLFMSSTSILLLLVVGVYLLLNPQTPTVTGMMGMPPTTTNNGIIALILISIAIIISVGVTLYFLYSRKDNAYQKKLISNLNSFNLQEKLTDSCERRITSEEVSKPFEVFLCYKKSSGKDFADHLKTGLEELGLHTFEDCKDIPKTVDTQEGWASFRDKALMESKYFVLLMTPGFELSSEVVKEIAMAKKQPNKTFVFFRLRSMGRNIVVNLGDDVLEIGKLEQVSFDSKEELLRLAHEVLLKDRK